MTKEQIIEVQKIARGGSLNMNNVTLLKNKKVNHDK